MLQGFFSHSGAKSLKRHPTPTSGGAVYQRKPEVIPPGNAWKKISTTRTIGLSNSDMFTTLQTTLGTLVAGHRAMVDRLLGVQDQLGAVTALAAAHSLEALQDAVEDCQKRVEALEINLKIVQ